MLSLRRAALPVAALLLTGVLAPSTSEAAATTVRITGNSLAGGRPVDAVQVLYADPTAFVRESDLVRGPELAPPQLAGDGSFSLAVEAGRPFYLRLSESDARFAGHTYLGANGGRAATHLAVNPITATTDLNLGTVTAIRLGSVTITTDRPGRDFTLRRLDGTPAGEGSEGSPGTSGTVGRVVPGRYLADVTGGDAQTLSPPTVTVPEGGNVSVHVTRQPLGSVSGRVLTRSGRPLAKVTVWLRQPGGSASDVARTDAQGRYVVDALKAGTYTFDFRGGRRTAASAYLDGPPRTVVLGVGTDKALSPVRMTHGGVVTGSVTLKKNENAQVHLLTRSGVSVTADDGIWKRRGNVAAFRTRGVASGTYTLIVQRQGNRYLKRTVTVTRGTATRLGRVTVNRTPLTVRGRVRSAVTGSVTFTSRPQAGRRLSRIAGPSVSSTGRYTAKVVPGTWFVSARGEGRPQVDVWGVAVETLKPRRLRVRTSRTYDVPVSALNTKVSGRVTFRGKPIVGITLLTAPPAGFVPRSASAPIGLVADPTDDAGRFEGLWPRFLPRGSQVRADGSTLFPDVVSPYFFVASPAKVSSGEDLEHVALTLSGS